jgi:hypothetical protein
LQLRVDWYEFTDVSQVCTASIIRAMNKKDVGETYNSFISEPEEK